MKMRASSPAGGAVMPAKGGACLLQIGQIGFARDGQPRERRAVHDALADRRRRGAAAKYGALLLRVRDLPRQRRELLALALLRIPRLSASKNSIELSPFAMSLSRPVTFSIQASQRLRRR